MLKSINRIKKLLLLVFIFFLLLLSSELIYSINKRPEIFGMFFIYLARNDINKSKPDYAMKNLDRAANFYLKQNKIEHPDKLATLLIVSSLQTKISAKAEVSEFLKNALSDINGFDRSKVSNIYYKIGLLLYRNGDIELANTYFTNSVSLDPTLSFLHIELANSYFNDENFEKGIEALNYCLSFDQPSKHCEEYININVKSSAFESVGAYQNIIDEHQFRIK